MCVIKKYFWNHPLCVGCRIGYLSVILTTIPVCQPIKKPAMPGNFGVPQPDERGIHLLHIFVSNFYCPVTYGTITSTSNYGMLGKKLPPIHFFEQKQNLRSKKA